jgi:spore coat polysaccharide biosynthesis predicted glycosyltransferase SpsG
MNFLIRTSGGPAPKNQNIGYGHLFRSINLAKSLSLKKTYFAIEDFGGSKQILRNHGIDKINIFKKNIKLESDINKTKKIIHENSIDMLIIDKRKISNTYLQKLNSVVKTVVIYDIFDYNFSSDLVINGFIGFKNQIIKNKFNTKCLLGPKYFILNKKFAQKKKGSKKIDILVTFGGFDASNLVEIFLSAAEDFLSNMSIKIILGPGTKKNSNIRNFEKKFNNRLSIIQTTSNMHQEISNAKFGICAGGFTTYEFAALKVPFAIISQVPHQLEIARVWEKKKIAYNLGIVNINTRKKIIDILQKIQKNNFKINLKNEQFDGLGIDRVSKEIKKLHKN